MIASESFASGNSYIHSIDPRLRVLFAFLLSVTVAVAEGFLTLGISLIIAIALIRAARLNIPAVSKRLTTLLGFLLLIWIVLPLTFQGDGIAQFGYLTVYRPGIELSTRISLKSTTILLLLIALVTTMPVTLLGHVLYFFRVPTKLVFLLLITYRYLFVIGEEYTRLRTAMRIRGFQAGTNLHSFKTIAYLVGMLFVRASLRAERVSRAMRLRGFKGTFHSLEDFRAFNTTILFPVLLTGTLGVLVYIEWIT